MFVWMNYGMTGGDFSWIRDELDERWKFQVNLARFNVRGIDLSGARVLDTGCGRGGNCSYLTRHHRPRQVVGLDLSAAQVAWCDTRFKQEGSSFVVGDAQRLPFAAESFDVVTNIESACHYPDKSGFYREVYRILTPEGHFGHSCDYSGIPGVEKWLTSAGFTIVAREDITDRVVEALVQNDGNLRALLSQITATRETRAFANRVHTALTYRIPTTFNSDHRYMSWILRKTS
jgi:O-methyltransferase